MLLIRQIFILMVIAVILAMSGGQAVTPIAQESVHVVQIELVDFIPVVVVETEPVEDRRVMQITAYTANDFSMNGLGITANGERVQEGRTIAADKSIPFGTEIFIPELDRTYTVSDRGGAISRGRLDLYMDSRADAMEFGVQELEVIIRN